MTTSTLVSIAYGRVVQKNKKIGHKKPINLKNKLNGFLIWLLSFLSSIILAISPYFFKELETGKMFEMIMQEQGLALLATFTSCAALIEMFFYRKKNPFPSAFHLICIIISLIIYFGYFIHNEQNVNN